MNDIVDDATGDRSFLISFQSLWAIEGFLAARLPSLGAALAKKMTANQAVISPITVNGQLFPQNLAIFSEIQQTLNINIPRQQRMLLDELPARFHTVAH